MRCWTATRWPKASTWGCWTTNSSSAARRPHPVIMQILEQVAEDEPEALTIYVGQTTPVAQAEELATEISERYPDMDVQTVAGGQDHYDYIIAVE